MHPVRFVRPWRVASRFCMRLTAAALAVVMLLSSSPVGMAQAAKPTTDDGILALLKLGTIGRMKALSQVDGRPVIRPRCPMHGRRHPGQPEGLRGVPVQVLEGRRPRHADPERSEGRVRRAQMTLPPTPDS